jgi:choline dehydrogenase-like flavoprotein
MKPDTIETINPLPQPFTARNCVVDKDCRSFDHPNLFISGSATMPTVGTVSVTLTIAALALRIGDLLKEEV